MKKLFALLAVAGLSASAYAADGKGTEFKFGGSMSQSFNWNDNTNFSAGSTAATPPLHESHWLQKNNFHVSGMTSDKMMAYINFYNAAVWGATSFNGGTPYSTTLTGTPGTTAPTYPNAISVSEAWMWWKASDMLSFKTGRQAFNLGSGFVVSKNEAAPMPYFFDALMGRASWDFLDLDFGGAKLADTGYSFTALSNFTDNEIVVYAVNAGIKSLPDMFKKFDIFAVAINGDNLPVASPALPGFATSNTNSFNLVNYGLYTKMDFAMVDLALNFVSQSGKQKGTTDTTFNGMAYDLEVGVNFPEFMKARLAVDYHNSSGDDPSTTTTNEGYQPLFYDLDKYSVSSIWGMGNLNNIKVGLTLSPSEESTYGLEYNMVSRVQAKAGATMNQVGSSFGQMFSPGAGVASSTEASVGSVISVWGKHNYGHGFNMMAGLDMISLGNFYKATGATAPGSAMGLKLGATYNF